MEPVAADMNCRRQHEARTWVLSMVGPEDRTKLRYRGGAGMTSVDEFERKDVAQIGRMFLFLVDHVLTLDLTPGLPPRHTPTRLGPVCPRM